MCGRRRCCCFQFSTALSKFQEFLQGIYYGNYLRTSTTHSEGMNIQPPATENTLQGGEQAPLTTTTMEEKNTTQQNFNQERVPDNQRKTA